MVESTTRVVAHALRQAAHRGEDAQDTTCPKHCPSDKGFAAALNGSKKTPGMQACLAVAEMVFVGFDGVRAWAMLDTPPPAKHIRYTVSI